MAAAALTLDSDSSSSSDDDDDAAGLDLFAGDLTVDDFMRLLGPSSAPVAVAAAAPLSDDTLSF